MESFEPLSFSELPGWRESDAAPAYAAFRRSARPILAGQAQQGSLGPAPAALRQAAEAALSGAGGDPHGFFERFFRPALIRAERGGPGFVTGYYEPVLPASRTRSARFSAPLHRLPPGLSALAQDERPDRAAIARGALDGQGLELVWLENEVEAFFVHVQGSARLSLDGGGEMRVGFAGRSGHAFTAIGRILVQAREMTLEEADMTGIRRWLAAHPERVDWLLHQNRSYIFFAEVAIRDPAEGPMGAAGVPLTALGSMAVDRGLHTFGLPFFLHAADLGWNGAPFRRLLVAQDTGAAILGRARGDIFVGSGEAAGRVAGAIRHACDFYALLPHGARP